MRKSIKQAIAGTPLEAPARALLRALRGAPQTDTPPTTDDRNALYDRQTDAVMRRLLSTRSNCVDVGCHEGAILDEILRFAPDGVHYAFEPLPHLFSALEAKYAAAKRVHLYRAALSEAAGTSSFQHVVTNPGYSGLRKRRYDRPDEDVVEIEVKVLRLDDVLPAELTIRLLKIDVEGAELGVIEGAREMLSRCRPYVVFEHGLGAADHYGTRPETVYDVLTDCGLQLSLMSDWLASNGTQTLSRAAFVNEFDDGRNFYFLAHP